MRKRPPSGEAASGDATSPQDDPSTPGDSPTHHRHLLVLPLLGALCALLASTIGCAGFLELLRLRVDLATKTVTSVRLEITENEKAFCPGDNVSLAAIATVAEGKDFATMGGGRGKVPWRCYDVVAEGGTFGRRGVLRITDDPRATWHAVPRVVVRPATQPNIQASVAVPIRYDCRYVVDLTGAHGSWGPPGSDGTDGSNGHDASCPFDSSSGSGGAGSNGSSGSNGHAGGDGQPGPVVALYVDRVFHRGRGEQILWVQLVCLGRGLRRRLYRELAIHPLSGRLVVKADGGNGGRGGTGGDGGDGGKGGQGCNGGSNGTDGSDGSDGAYGAGGDGGNGGRFVIHATRRAARWRAALGLSNQGGGGGLGSPWGARGHDGPPATVIVTASSAGWFTRASRADHSATRP